MTFRSDAKLFTRNLDYNQNVLLFFAQTSYDIKNHEIPFFIGFRNALLSQPNQRKQSRINCNFPIDNPTIEFPFDNNNNN